MFTDFATKIIVPQNLSFNTVSKKICYIVINEFLNDRAVPHSYQYKIIIKKKEVGKQCPTSFYFKFGKKSRAYLNK